MTLFRVARSQAMLESREVSALVVVRLIVGEVLSQHSA